MLISRLNHFLEIGSTGLFLKLISQLFPHANVCGTDYSEQNSEEYRNVPFDWGGQYKFYKGNPEVSAYSIDNDFFDLILCAEVIERMSIDPMGLISELNRVLCVGGKALITTPNIVSSRSIINSLNSEMPFNFFAYNKSLTTDRHNIEYSPGVLSKLMIAGGFSVLDMDTVNSWSKPDTRLAEIYSLYKFSDKMRGDNIMITIEKKALYLIDTLILCMFENRVTSEIRFK
jgi:hypothetical protein